MKRWVVRHPVVFVAAFVAVWSAATTVHVLLAIATPVAAVALLGWWRETGMCAWRPEKRWLLVVPPLVVGAVQVDAVAPVVLGVELARVVCCFALRWGGTWRVPVALAVVLCAADVVLVGWVFALAAGFCLTALRWRTNSVWPLVLLHLVLVTPSWWFAAALVGYGVWLLHGQAVLRRPTVRVLCFDEGGRVLLVRWRDPTDGTSAWEAPGGGIEPGEAPFDTARRELSEETGLPPECVRDRHVLVRRDIQWNGMRMLGDEPYYLAEIDRPHPISREGLEPHEQRLITEFRWVPPADAAALPGRLQVRDLERVAASLRG